MIPRRAALLLPLAATARAQEAPFPSRSISLLVGFSPGGGNDILARLLAPKLSELLGQPVAVENRTGGSGSIAMLAVARARPDGHAMVLGSIGNVAQSPLLLRPPPFDPLQDITPVQLVASVPLVVTVPANSAARDIAGLIALARANPGKLNFASNGPGSLQHLAAELFMLQTGIRMTHVPYRGSGQVVSDLMSGVVDVNFDTMPSVLQHIRQGGLRGLAVTTARRVPALPEVPTVIEGGVAGYDLNAWYMLCGPANLPPAITARWAQALHAAFAVPELRSRIEAAGFDVGGGTPAEAAALLRAEVARYAEVIRRADVRME